MKHKLGYMIVSVLMVSLLLVFLMGCSNQTIQDNKIKIGYTPLVYGQPSFVANDLGFFEEQGITAEMIKFESATQVVNALLAGDLDFVAISPCLSVLAAEEKSEDNLFKVHYYNTDSLEHPISFLLVKKGSEIKELKDLKGKTIGTFPGNILSRTSAKLLLKDLMDVNKDITFVDIGPQIQAQAIESGMVDAMFSLEPFITISLEQGVAEILHVAPQLSIMDNIPGGCGFASTKFVDERPEIASKMRIALDKSIDYIRENEGESKKVLIKYTPLNDDLAVKVRQPEYVKSTEIDGKGLQEQYDVMMREGIFNNGLNAQELVLS